jgi:hypothetical protein
MDSLFLFVFLTEVNALLLVMTHKFYFCMVSSGIMQHLLL